MRRVLTDPMTIEFDAEAILRAKEVFNGIVAQEADSPGILDAMLFLLLLAKGEQIKPGTVEAAIAAMQRYRSPAEPEVV